jgi:hypothetical protein
MNFKVPLFSEKSIVKSSGAKDFKSLFNDPVLKSDPIIIKPKLGSK